MGTQETIIYRLVLTNLGFGPYLPFSMFWGLKRHGPTGTPMLTHLMDLLGYLLSRNHVYNFSDLAPPPPPPLKVNWRLIILILHLMIQ